MSSSSGSSKTHIPFYNPIHPTDPKIWPDYTLVMPVCAVGNIGQLACDLIISTLLSKGECKLVGRIHSNALMSVVGPNAFVPSGGPPTTSTELYQSKKHKFLIMQQRTSYFKHLKAIYIDELVHWIKESQFDRVLVLSSSFAQCNPDTSILGTIAPAGDVSQISTITTSQFQQDDNWTRLNLKQIQDKRTIKVVQDGLSFLPGSGITKPLIKACEKASIAAAFLVDFCSEGINIQDCYAVANIVDALVGFGYAPQPLPSAVSDKQAAPMIIPGGSAGDSVHNQSPSAWVEPFSWTQAQC